MFLKITKTINGIYIGEENGQCIRVKSYLSFITNRKYYRSITFSENAKPISNYTFTIDNKNYFFDKNKSYLYIKCNTKHLMYFVINLKNGIIDVYESLPKFEKSEIGEKVKIKIK